METFLHLQHTEIMWCKKELGQYVYASGIFLSNCHMCLANCGLLYKAALVPAFVCWHIFNHFWPPYPEFHYLLFGRTILLEDSLPPRRNYHRLSFLIILKQFSNRKCSLFRPCHRQRGRIPSKCTNLKKSPVLSLQFVQREKL